jgi:hypothetical protein
MRTPSLSSCSSPYRYGSALFVFEDGICEVQASSKEYQPPCDATQMGARWGDRVLHDLVPLVEILLKVLEDDLLY